MNTTGLTAEEAQAALPGQNINKVCRAYTAPTGTARVLYDIREPAKESAPEGVAEGETKPSNGRKKRKKAEA